MEKNVAKKIIEITNENGDPIFIEVEVSEREAEFVASAGNKLASAAKKFEQALQPAMTMASSMIRKISDTKIDRPTSVELQFGIKFNGSVDAWIVSGSGEGSINLKLTWQTGK